MVHKMKLMSGPYKMIADGRKTIELRLYDDKRRKLHIGDKIVFTCLEDPKEQLTVTVRQLHIFRSFAELYQNLPLNKCGYSDEEIADATPDDMNLYYDPKEQQKYGVVGIELERIQ